MAHSLLAKSSVATLPLLIFEREGLKAWESDQPKPIRRWLSAAGFTAKPGSFCVLPGDTAAPEAVVAGWDPEGAVWTAAGLAARLPAGSYRIAEAPAGVDPEQLALGWCIGGYRFTRYKSAKGRLPQLVCPVGASRSAAEGLAEAVFLVRDLINTPANDMGPAELADATRKLARRHGAKVKVIAGERLLAANYPAIHAVGRASATAPRLIDMTWGRSGPKVTVVGKGVCFDSGGLDLKSAAGMVLMKKDMGGGAHALGLAAAIMAAKLPLRLRVLVPAVENAVAGNAMRPSDIIQTRKGLTVEVGNTDAEGRLVLADALVEACKGKPDMVLDFATLTGAARVALGTEVPALFSNDDALAERLLSHAASQGDPLWRMPLHQPYRRLLESAVADMNNVSRGSFGGAITAALFLETFIEPGISWAHIDLMAWNLSSRAGRPEGGEAMGLRAAFAMISALVEERTAKGRKSGVKRS
jgi:leucyl aminopeptidase